MATLQYDFSNYQGGLEATLGGALAGYSYADHLRQDRKKELQGDEERKMRLQILRDQQDEVARRGGLARPSMENVVAGNGADTGTIKRPPLGPTPGFNPGASAPPGSPAAQVLEGHGEFGGSVAGEHGPGNGPQASTPDAAGDGGFSVRKAIGGALSRFRTNVTTGGFQPFQAEPSMQKVGPSDDERMAEAQHGYRSAEQGAANGAAMDRTRFETQGAWDRNHEDNVYRLRGDQIRAADGRRGQSSQILGGLNARVDDIRAQYQSALRVANDPQGLLLEVRGNQPEFARRMAEAKSQASRLGAELNAAMKDRDELLEQERGRPFTHAPEPDNSPLSLPPVMAGPPKAAAQPASPQQALAQLDAQRQAALEAGKDPQAVEQRYQQERQKLVGRALGAAPAGRPMGGGASW